jgi:hypothetical protein
MKNEVKLLRKQLNKCYEDGVLVSLQESLNFIQSQSSGFEMIKSQLIDGVPVVSSGWDSMPKVDCKQSEINSCVKVLETYTLKLKEHIS